MRISNNSHCDLKNIEINSPANGLVHFGMLKSKQNSGYQKLKEAYPIMAVTGTISDKKIEFLPDDYIGEQLLQPGKYTYELSVIEVDSIKYFRSKFVVEKK
ncbi:hypothetical protein SanaruYs_22960 [Chryseotalea sanaruensis]|uniref:Uncharacterized protein n=1 Tax=Chryseotalea sanaruensis TaxID=2482724 RepID=A0A401UB41_9BACT|nr:hypothetical protein [Chryseotalea sanaruensis]GCC52064.1 hypothetical protein SanaruYs_22960 [Chryseotalea sanaruensis]